MHARSLVSNTICSCEIKLFPAQILLINIGILNTILYMSFRRLGFTACLIVLLSVVFSGGVVYAAVTWTETQPAGDVNKFWDAGAVSEDGDTMVAITQNTAVYLSTNAGSTWEEVKPRGLSSATQWQTTAISSNGQVIAVAGQNGMYISTDQGDSWTAALTGVGANNFTSVSMSPSGQYLIAGSYGGRLYTSSNSGSSWTERQPAGNANKSWQTVGISGDGQFMLAGILSSRLYKSIDGGVNWSEVQPAGDVDKDWYVTMISPDGLNAFVGVGGGRLYRSIDMGSNWSEVQPAGDTNISWHAGSISYDGLTILIGVWNGRLYLSTDGGNIWSQTQPAGDANKYWWIAAVSGNAKKFLAGTYINGRLYLGAEPSPTPTSTPIPTSTPSSTSTSNSNSDPCPGYSICPNAGGSSSSSVSTISSGGQMGESGLITIQHVAGEMALAVTASNLSTSSLLSSNSSVPVPWVQGLNLVGGVIQFNAVSAFNGYPVTQLVKPATIIMTYDPTKLNGRSPNLLRIGWFNPTTKRWQVLNNNTVIKPGENLIANTTVNLGYYAVVLPNGVSLAPVLGIKTGSQSKNSKKVLGTSTKCETYIVKSGDTLWSISNKKMNNGSHFNSIIKSNNLNSTVLIPGQKLKVGC